MIRKLSLLVLFHDIETEGTLLTIEMVATEFSSVILLLVDEVTKFNKVSWDLINQHDSIVDKRVISIKFAYCLIICVLSNIWNMKSGR